MSLKSHPSSESHVTLVEKDMGANSNTGLMSEDSLKALTYSPSHAPKNIWIDWILGLFSARSSIHNEGVKIQTCEAPEVGDGLSQWSCPWIQPVYVLSNQQDVDKNSITKIAKCTIDTGNLQGNIVSRDFVEKVLGFPPSSFEKLTKAEEAGGTGITGEPHIPQGAIRLTWYHKNSTRVFRDMRFLISSAPQCDLIIGAWSIHKDKILDVPCLMVDRENRPSQSPILVKLPKNPDKVLRKLDVINRDVNANWLETKANKKDDDSNDPGILAEFDKEIQQSEDEVDVVGWFIIVYNIIINNEAGKKQGEVTDIWSEINERWSLIRPDIQDECNEFYTLLYDKLQPIIAELHDVRKDAKASATGRDR